mmetsp:Transcript_11903/g.33670  ORF Transcript_11903/g.33670 Transcript_11903/m.33670 type:complete len:263 (+) Transcript_11903:1824-2612(+)
MAREHLPREVVEELRAHRLDLERLAHGLRDELDAVFLDGLQGAPDDEAPVPTSRSEEEALVAETQARDRLFVQASEALHEREFRQGRPPRLVRRRDLDAAVNSGLGHLATLCIVVAEGRPHARLARLMFWRQLARSRAGRPTRFGASSSGVLAWRVARRGNCRRGWCGRVPRPATADAAAALPRVSGLCAGCAGAGRIDVISARAGRRGLRWAWGRPGLHRRGARRDGGIDRVPRRVCAAHGAEARRGAGTAAIRGPGATRA